MNENNKFKIKEFFSSFKYWPRIFKLLFSVNKKYLIFITFINIILAVIPSITLLITQGLINSVMYNTSKNFNRVLYYFAAMLILSLIKNILNSFYSYYLRVYQSLLSYELNIKVMKKSNTLSLKDFEDPDVYDKLQRAQNEIGSRPFQIYSSIMSIVSSVITLITSSLILIYWKWWIVIILLVFPLISTLFSFKLGKIEYLIQQKRASTMRKSWYYSFLLTKDLNYKEVKMFDIGDYILARYKKIFDRYLRVDKKIIKKTSKVTFIFGFIEELVGDLVTLFIIWSTFIGSINIGNLISYTKAISLTEANFQQFLSVLLGIYKDNLYIKQLFEFMDYESSSNQKNNSNNEYELKEINSIEFKNVSFKYPNADKYALKNISFSVNKGDIVGVVGKNGSGKTTLIKLLTKLYDLQEGEILINSISINDYSAESLRKKIATVFQDFIKYELTVRDNIGFGNIECIKDDDSINVSAKDSGADKFINTFKNGINTQLGNWFDDGMQLSGGQWQKIAISRAFIRKADLFILDEPSSALDPVSEKEIFNNFFEISKDKIGIFTSHRFSSVKFATNILVFDDGVLVEQGSHSELVSLDGYYKKLYKVQALPFLENEMIS